MDDRDDHSDFDSSKSQRSDGGKKCEVDAEACSSNYRQEGLAAVGALPASLASSDNYGKSEWQESKVVTSDGVETPSIPTHWRRGKEKSEAFQTLTAELDTPLLRPGVAGAQSIPWKNGNVPRSTSYGDQGTSQTSLWQQLKVAKTTDSSRSSDGSYETPAHFSRELPTVSGCGKMTERSLLVPQCGRKGNSSTGFFEDPGQTSSSFDTSESGTTGERQREQMLGEVEQRLKGGGVSNQSDSSQDKNVVGMKTLIERQRQSYIRRLQREIRWLEKVEKLLIEVQGRKKSSRPKAGKDATTKRLQNSDKCNVCKLGELSPAVNASPLFVRCNFLKKFQDFESEVLNQQQDSDRDTRRELFDNKHDFDGTKTRVKGSEGLTPEDAFEHEDASVRAVNGSDKTSAIQLPDDGDVSQNSEPLSYQPLSKWDTTNSTDCEDTSPLPGIASRCALRSEKENVDPTSICTHHCPCIAKQRDEPMTTFDSRRSTNQSRSVQTSPVTAPRPTSSHETAKGKATGHDRYFVTVPVSRGPKETGRKPLSDPGNQSYSSHTKRNTRVTVPSSRDVETDVRKAADKKRRNRTGITWFVPVQSHQQWLQPRECGDGSNSSMTANVATNEAAMQSTRELSLQDALRCFNSNFIVRSQARVKRVTSAASKRKHRTQAIAVAMARNRPLVVTKPLDFTDQLHHPRKRNFTHKEMREQTERMYRTLPEIVQQCKCQNTKEVVKTNRLMVEVFKRKVQEKALQGKVSYSINDKLI